MIAAHFASPETPPETDAGRRNMALLIQLRWIAVIGQLVTIALVHFGMGIRLPLLPLLLAPLALVTINIGGLWMVQRRRAITNAELTAALLVDVAALTWQLHFSGGIANPFTALYLLQIGIAAMLLRPWSSWAIVAASGIGLGVLAIDPVPLALPPHHSADPLALYLEGSLICFALMAVLLVLSITRIARNLRNRDTALAAVRQRAAEEEHIVRMGLLASGAAHELGTPLASLSVILGDWQRMPALSGNTDIAADIEDMQAEVARCKTIVSGILQSAGETRGVGTEFTTVHDFLRAVAEEWRQSRFSGVLDLRDAFGPDVAIVSDPALRQVIGNVIGNAAEVSPGWVGITSTRDGDHWVITVADRGPGFSAEMLAGFGQPYRSTKGRPGGGLGLFLLVNVLRTLGGTATASNRAEGGALVRLRLPLAALARPEDAAHE